MLLFRYSGGGLVKKKRDLFITVALTVFVMIVALFCLYSCADANEADSDTATSAETDANTFSDVDFQSITDTETETAPAPETTTAPPETTTEWYYEPDTDAPYTEEIYVEPDTTEPYVETTTAAVTQPVLPPVADGALAGCLFIGDSRTDGLRLTGALPGADIFCSVGLSVFGATSEVVTVDGVAVNLAQLLSSRTYSKVYILLGINEIGYDHGAIASKFSELISFIQGYQPGAKIIIQANLHVTTARSSQGDAFNNNNINSLNQHLQALTNGSTICWLDANQLLDDASGGLNEAYSGGDGIHLNWDCYVMWGQWIASQNSYY